jgi:hypothetical protein
MEIVHTYEPLAEDATGGPKCTAAELAKTAKKVFKTSPDIVTAGASNGIGLGIIRDNLAGAVVSAFFYEGMSYFTSRKEMTALHLLAQTESSHFKFAAIKV